MDGFIVWMILGLCTNYVPGDGELTYQLCKARFQSIHRVIEPVPVPAVVSSILVKQDACYSQEPHHKTAQLLPHNRYFSPSLTIVGLSELRKIRSRNPSAARLAAVPSPASDKLAAASILLSEIASTR